MYGHYDYGAHHNFGGSSSQPNFGGSSSQPNVGGSSSQPNVRGSSSPVRQFSLDDEDFTNVYSPQFSESFREEQSPVEEVEEIQVSSRRRSRPEDVKRPRRRGHRRKKPWINVVFHGPLRKRLHCAKVGCSPLTAIQTYTSGASHSDYLQRALTDYQAEYGVSFTLLHCWEVLKDCEKWSSGEVPLFMQEGEDGKYKRYKSNGSSSFNTKDLGEGSINLNTTVGTEDENEMEEVQEVRRPKPMGKDQAKRKMKRGSASSASSFDARELAKMMASEYVMATNPYNTQRNQEMSELLKIKNRELELKAAELKIRRMENRQRNKMCQQNTF
ncbi:RNA-directed DNA polymerase, eukaryota [Tanacetum coccineum]